MFFVSDFSNEQKKQALDIFSNMLTSLLISKDSPLYKSNFNFDKYFQNKSIEITKKIFGEGSLCEYYENDKNNVDNLLKSVFASTDVQEEHLQINMGYKLILPIVKDIKNFVDNKYLSLAGKYKDSANLINAIKTEIKQNVEKTNVFTKRQSDTIKKNFHEIVEKTVQENFTSQARDKFDSQPLNAQGQVLAM